MRKVFFIFLTILAAVAVFSVIIFLLIQNKGKGALQVTSNLVSKVYLDGKSIGNTPLCMCNLKDMLLEGEYIIKLVPTVGNFQVFEQKITISPKVLTVVDKSFAEKGLDSASVISLSKIADQKDAQISVVTFPSAAQVFLDNNLQAQGTVLLRNITESDHELKITKASYKDKIIRIRTVLGFRLEALVYLGLDINISSPSAVVGVPLLSSSSASVVDSNILILSTPTGFLRVRETPSISAIEIAQVRPGETYTFISEENGWYKIKLVNGKSGWISSQYAKKTN